MTGVGRPLRYFAYVPRAHAAEALKLGWRAEPNSRPAHHDAYSVNMEWCGNGAPQMPWLTPGSISDPAIPPT